MLRGEGDSHTGTEPRAQSMASQDEVRCVLGLNSQSGVKPAWPRLRDRTGNNWPPILLSQQWSYPRSTIRLSHAGQEAAETSGLSLQRDHPFWSMSDAVCPWHSRGARVGGGASRPEMSLPTLLKHTQDITIRYYARLGLMP